MDEQSNPSQVLPQEDALSRPMLLCQLYFITYLSNSHYCLDHIITITSAGLSCRDYFTRWSLDLPDLLAKLGCE
nr:hypothetical protein Q903MT_gene1467 [Picea sitchensis]